MGPLLRLLPGESDQEYTAEADCWRLTERIATTEEYRTFEIDPDESSRRPVDLYATPDADGCRREVSIRDDDLGPGSRRRAGGLRSLESH